MAHRLSAILVLAVVLSISAFAPGVHAAENGGAECAGCTVVVALVEQHMQLDNLTVSQAMKKLCSLMPEALAIACDLALIEFEPKVAPLIEAGETPDVVCNALKYCKAETGVCRLFPAKQADYASHVKAVVHQYSHLQKFNICTILPAVCQVVDHLPFSDTDGDKFSTIDGLRGAYFRGKDCDDLDATVFPGRASSDAFGDANCNGIYGIDATTGRPYEDEWCAGTGAMGVASLGDSATAHFHIPEAYFDTTKQNADTFKHVLRLLEDEADWPMLSWSTGHLNASDFAPDVSGPMTSLYSLMRERNLCNHRDYQNLGVNGARVAELLPFDTLVGRNASLSKPLLTIFSMVGNDVCGSFHGDKTMTTPKEYHDRVTAAILRADATLPKGSHIVLVPLVDGRILYDTMGALIHPIGRLNNDVTYTNFYDYLNCLDVSPCWGWMNSNATVRNTTWQVASSLNAQLPLIVSELAGNLTNVQVHYLGNIYDDAIRSYNGTRSKMIEPVDGFHPAQLANSYIGQMLFERVLAAGILAPPNPNNAAIKAKFGDQGGY